MYDSEYDEVKAILDSNHITDIEDIEYGGECFDDLMKYYSDQGEIPYGVMKARTGMPDEWLYDRLCDLGLDKEEQNDCLLYTSPSPRDRSLSRMPSSA